MSFLFSDANNSMNIECYFSSMEYECNAMGTMTPSSLKILLLPITKYI